MMTLMWLWVAPTGSKKDDVDEAAGDETAGDAAAVTALKTGDETTPGEETITGEETAAGEETTPGEQTAEGEGTMEQAADHPQQQPDEEEVAGEDAQSEADEGVKLTLSPPIPLRLH